MDGWLVGRSIFENCNERRLPPEGAEIHQEAKLKRRVGPTNTYTLAKEEEHRRQARAWVRIEGPDTLSSVQIYQLRDSD